MLYRVVSAIEHLVVMLHRSNECAALLICCQNLCKCKMELHEKFTLETGGGSKGGSLLGWTDHLFTDLAAVHAVLVLQIFYMCS